MRPHALTHLFASVESLPGIAGKTSKALAKLGMSKVKDLAFHLPSGLNRYPFQPSLRSCTHNQTAALEIQVLEHIPKSNARQPYKIVCADTEGTLIHLVFFHAYLNTLVRQFPLNAKKLIAGNIENFFGQYQMTHPEKIWPASRADQWREVEPTYPLTAGVSQGHMQKFVSMALDRLPNLPEWLPEDVKTKHNWPRWFEALMSLHSPKSEADIEPHTPARKRLAFDELLSHQLGLAMIRKQNSESPGQARQAEGKLRAKVLAAFGFDLTDAQSHALGEITQDLEAPRSMMRLLQGDVGSGKTLVALLALSHVIEAGYQGALLVPTEVLAQQHYATVSAIAEQAGLRIALLTGRIKGKARQKIYEDLQDGHIDLVVGTHALIQDDVHFKDLGLVVIDEQHRFGVEQRARLTQKGHQVDILVMTATPIPRTLMLTSYGDLDVSRMHGKPKGQKDIQTHVMSLQKLNEVYEGVKRVLEKGEQVYWVCPLVEESEALDLAAATDRYDDLVKWFGPEALGLVHGQMKGPEKDQAMEDFKTGKTRILVSTTVIEVGIDVPMATAIIIEHAERFGLSQLHQLRGRVGRNNLDCFCLLLYGPAWSASTKARFQIMRKTNDGFLIAEEDLKLRGGGDLLGTKQSGLPSYHFADLDVHFDLLLEAHQLARELLRDDPTLNGQNGDTIRTLMHLFDHDRMAPLYKAAA